MVVAGCSARGLLHAALAFLRRPAVAIVVDQDHTRRAAAECLRTLADEEHVRLEILRPDELPGRLGGSGADDVLVTGPSGCGIGQLPALLASGGCLCLCEPESVVPPPPLAVVDARRVTIVAPGVCGGDLVDVRRALGLVERGGLDLGPIVSHVGGIAALPEAWEGTRHGVFPGRVIVYPQVHGPGMLPTQRWGSQAETELLASGSDARES